MLPLAAEPCIGLAIVSYDGGVVFGLNADHETMPDLAVLRDGIEESLAELRSFAPAGAR
jgi:diacylglycerol O-acyltransferase / wax synthase